MAIKAEAIFGDASSSALASAPFPRISHISAG